MKRVAFLAVAFAIPAMAGNSTTQRSFPVQLKLDAPPPTISSFNPNDFNLNYRPPAPPPGLGNVTITPGKAASDAQLWHSFSFNGQTYWNRPAILDITPHVVKDTTTGKLFYYQDSARIVKGPLENRTYRMPAAGHRLPDGSD